MSILNSSKRIILLALGAAALVVGALAVMYWMTQPDQPESDEAAIQEEFTRIVRPLAEKLSADQHIGIVSWMQEGDWAVVEFNRFYTTGGEPVPAGGSVVLFRRIDGLWHGEYKDPTRYNEWLDEMPESIMPAESKRWLRYSTAED